MMDVIRNVLRLVLFWCSHGQIPQESSHLHVQSNASRIVSRALHASSLKVSDTWGRTVLTVTDEVGLFVARPREISKHCGSHFTRYAACPNDVHRMKTR